MGRGKHVWNGIDIGALVEGGRADGREMNEDLDEIGRWTEIKLNIIKEYAAAYSQILAKQKKTGLHHIYIDAFAGAGMHISKDTGAPVKGSPTNALELPVRFEEYHFVEIDSERVGMLRSLSEGMSSVWIHEGDCNRILRDEVFPRVKYENYRRALCLLDPYGLDLDWAVIHAAGQMQTIEVFVNFPIMDMNRNVLRHNLESAEPSQVARMNAFWGDESWKQAVYEPRRTLFGETWDMKTSNEYLVKAFADRLKNVAGFLYVPEPILMRNSKNAPLYYFFFASCNEIGGKIVKDIFDKYRDEGV